MLADGVFVVDGDSFTRVGFIPTGIGTHGLYPSRDGTKLYVSNRGSHKVHGQPHGPGSISVIDFATRTVEKTWPIPGGGSPDMGNVSADGKQLWLSGRYDNVVYDIDTTTGAVTQIPRRQGAARPDRLAAARPLFARPHRQHALEQFPTELPRDHCEERSEGAIPTGRRSAARDCFAALAMTKSETGGPT